MQDIFIQELIKCEKVAVSAEKRDMKNENRSYRNNIELISKDGLYNFKMFMRQSAEFIEDFSIGLIWLNPNEHINLKKEITLFRCQGPHDGKEEKGFDIHHDYHTHTFTKDDFNNKRFIKPSKRNAVNDFSCFDEAFIYFLKHCAVTNIEKHINVHKYFQLKLT